MKTMLIIGLVLFTIFLEENKLTGRWETKPSRTGSVTSLLFRPDSTYEGYINRKPFLTGKYTWKDSLVTILESGCNGQTGTYKLVFFCNDDSLRFIPVSDSCNERREGMKRIVLGRIKK